MTLEPLQFVLAVGTRTGVPSSLRDEIPGTANPWAEAHGYHPMPLRGNVYNPMLLREKDQL